MKSKFTHLTVKTRQKVLYWKFLLWLVSWRGFSLSTQIKEIAKESFDDSMKMTMKIVGIKVDRPDMLSRAFSDLGNDRG